VRKRPAVAAIPAGEAEEGVPDTNTQFPKMWSELVCGSNGASTMRALAAGLLALASPLHAGSETVATPAEPSAAERDRAAIEALEKQWGKAILTQDFAVLERIIAPEFTLAGVFGQGRASLTKRDEWMRNLRNFQSSAFDTQIVEVVVAGDTAVALVQGQWTVKRWPDRPAEAMRFAVTDTWVRREGGWQVIYRYSDRLPEAPWPPPEK
jgi:ketosteroid isomerase-like protein